MGDMQVVLDFIYRAAVDLHDNHVLSCFCGRAVSVGSCSNAAAAPAGALQGRCVH